MFCPKCGREMVNGRCEYCGYQEYNEYNNTQNNYSASNGSEPKDAGIVKLLGILSFFFPILSIIALIMGRGYNKANNYGESSDMKVGKTCAKVSLGLSIASVIFIILFYVAVIGFAFSKSGEWETIAPVEDTIYMAIAPIFMA